MKNFKKYILLGTIVLGFAISSYGQSKTLNSITSGVGIGIDDQSRTYIATSIDFEHFLSKRISLGLAFDHLSTYNIKDENESIYLEGKGFTINEYSEDYMESFLSSSLLLRYLGKTRDFEAIINDTHNTNYPHRSIVLWG